MESRLRIKHPLRRPNGAAATQLPMLDKTLAARVAADHGLLGRNMTGRERLREAIAAEGRLAPLIPITMMKAATRSGHLRPVCRDAETHARARCRGPRYDIDHVAVLSDPALKRRTSERISSIRRMHLPQLMTARAPLRQVPPVRLRCRILGRACAWANASRSSVF